MQEQAGRRVAKALSLLPRAQLLLRVQLQAARGEGLQGGWRLSRQLSLQLPLMVEVPVEVRQTEGENCEEGKA